MANTRSKKIHPLKAFENVQAIVLLIDSEFVIRYANSACCKWVGIPEDNLIGLRCIYTSAELENPLKNRVTGLCPPPEVFNGLTNVGFVSRQDATSNKIWRKAVFSLLNYGDLDLVLVVASGDELDTLPEASERDYPIVEPLHDALAAIGIRDQRLHTLESLVGTSPHAIRIRRQVVAAIESHADILIVGPAGSGREHMARTIFTHRKPAGANLVPINCKIADSELIQQSVKQCIIQQKNRGSHDCLLLRDVDQLGSAAQNELLGFSRLPGFQLRTISIARHSLLDLSKEGKFSIGLAHYLSTQAIETVAIKKRREDIPFLAQAFVENENSRQIRQISGLNPSVVELLAEYQWPRNLDQLRETIEHAVVNATLPIIRIQDLPQEIQLGINAARIGSAEETAINMDQYLEEIETELIARALRQAKNNKTKAAGLLSLNRARLARRLEHLGFTEKELDESASNVVDASAFEEAD